METLHWRGTGTSNNRRQDISWARMWSFAVREMRFRDICISLVPASASRHLSRPMHRLQVLLIH